MTMVALVLGHVQDMAEMKQWMRVASLLVRTLVFVAIWSHLLVASSVRIGCLRPAA